MRLSKHGFMRSLVTFSLTALVLLYSNLLPLPSVRAESISDLKAQLEQLDAAEAENNAQLERLRDDVTQKRACSDALQAQIDAVQQDIDALEEEIAVLDERIGQGERQAVADGADALQPSLHAVNQPGGAASLYMDNAVLLSYLQENGSPGADDAPETDLAALEAQAAQDTADRAALLESRASLDEARSALIVQYAENQAQLTQAEQDAAQAEAEAARLAEEKAAAADAVDVWYEAYHAALEAAENNAGGAGYAAASGFVWPMPGYTYITCYYGDDGHRGIDIAGSGIYGEPIVAAAGGTVAYSGWMDSYGYCVFIDHGDGYSTRYAHASALACSAGDTVSAGQTIAYVGSTGNSTGPHLHFEVLQSGSTTNPFEYF